MQPVLECRDKALTVAILTGQRLHELGIDQVKQLATEMCVPETLVDEVVEKSLDKKANLLTLLDQSIGAPQPRGLGSLSFAEFVRPVFLASKPGNSFAEDELSANTGDKKDLTSKRLAEVLQTKPHINFVRAFESGLSVHIFMFAGQDLAIGNWLQVEESVRLSDTRNGEQLVRRPDERFVELCPDLHKSEDWRVLVIEPDEGQENYGNGRRWVDVRIYNLSSGGWLHACRPPKEFEETSRRLLTNGCARPLSARLWTRIWPLFGVWSGLPV